NHSVVIRQNDSDLLHMFSRAAAFRAIKNTANQNLRHRFQQNSCEIFVTQTSAFYLSRANGWIGGASTPRDFFCTGADLQQREKCFAPASPQRFLRPLHSPLPPGNSSSPTPTR